MYKNILKCILKHANIKNFPIKSNVLFLLIIKVKTIDEFNVLSFSLWILSS